MVKIDWRLALLSLITVPVGLFFFALMMRGSKESYENTVVKTKALNDTAVEYINGIEVIKAFGKAKTSYEKFVIACFVLAFDWRIGLVLVAGIALYVVFNTVMQDDHRHSAFFLPIIRIRNQISMLSLISPLVKASRKALSGIKPVSAFRMPKMIRTFVQAMIFGKTVFPAICRYPQYRKTGSMNTSLIGTNQDSWRYSPSQTLIASPP